MKVINNESEEHMSINVKEYIKNTDNEELKYFLEELQEEKFTDEEKEIILLCAVKRNNKFLRYDMATFNCLYGNDYVMYNVPHNRMEIYNSYVGRIDLYIPFECMYGKSSQKVYDFCKLINEDLKKNFFDLWFSEDPNEDNWYNEASRNPYSLEPTSECKETRVTKAGYKKINEIIEKSLSSINLMGDNPFDYLTVVGAIKKSLFKKYNLVASSELEEKLTIGYYDVI